MAGMKLALSEALVDALFTGATALLIWVLASLDVDPLALLFGRFPFPAPPEPRRPPVLLPRRTRPPTPREGFLVEEDCEP